MSPWPNGKLNVKEILIITKSYKSIQINDTCTE